MFCSECHSPTGTESPLCDRCRSAKYRARTVQGIYFKPWRGQNYGPQSRWHVPVLVVGESHYEWCPERWKKGDLIPETATQEIVGAISLEHDRKAHWTKIAIVMTGENPFQRSPDGTMQEFWQSVDYYNYVQEGVGLDNRQRRHPTCSHTRKRAFLQSSRT